MPEQESERGALFGYVNSDADGLRLDFRASQERVASAFKWYLGLGTAVAAYVYYPNVSFLREPERVYTELLLAYGAFGVVLCATLYVIGDVLLKTAGHELRERAKAAWIIARYRSFAWRQMSKGAGDFSEVSPPDAPSRYPDAAVTNTQAYLSVYMALGQFLLILMTTYFVSLWFVDPAQWWGAEPPALFIQPESVRTGVKIVSAAIPLLLWLQSQSCLRYHKFMWEASRVKRSGTDVRFPCTRSLRSSDIALRLLAIPQHLVGWGATLIGLTHALTAQSPGLRAEIDDVSGISLRCLCVYLAVFVGLRIVYVVRACVMATRSQHDAE